MNTSSSSPRNHRRVGNHQDKVIRLGKSITEKSASFHFHGKSLANQGLLRRPKTDPDLLSGHHNHNNKQSGSSSSSSPPDKSLLRLTKLLLNVTVQRSLGAVHVIISPESTVVDLVAAVVRKYAKEGRRPSLPTTNPSDFNLHYSQFSLESLGREEKLITLGSRNFFMCPSKNVAAAAVAVDAAVVTSSSSSASCSNQVEKASKTDLSWFKFIDFFILSL